MNSCEIRYASRAELARVNELRAMVHALHAAGRPDIFRPEFSEALQQHVYAQFASDRADVIVALSGGTICGYTIAEYMERPQSAYNLARRYYHIEEFGVDAAYRRRGIARAMLAFCRQEAARRGFPRIELDLWAFNEDALAFYEAMGLRTYRRMMELEV